MREVVVAGTFLFTLSTPIYSQTTATLEPLSIQTLIDKVDAYHPSVLSAKRQAEAATQDVVATKRQRWAEVSLIAETDNNTNLTSNATRTARVQQTLWDFGRVSSLVSNAEANSSLADYNTQLQAQTIQIRVINAWQQFLASYHRQQTAQESLVLLRGYQMQMQRRVNAQASPSIDLELVNSRVLQTTVEFESASAELDHSLFVLEQLTGMANLKSHTSTLLVSRDSLNKPQQPVAPVDWNAIAQLHPSVKMAEFEWQASKHQLKTLQSELMPQIYARVDQPLAKTQSVTNTKANWFIGLSYTPGAGFSRAAQAQSQAMRIDSAQETISASVLEVESELRNDLREFTSASTRIPSLQKSVTGASNVLQSYQRQFQAGRKSWLDLLNAARELSQAQYLIADTLSIYAASALRLQVRSQGQVVLTTLP